MTREEALDEVKNYENYPNGLSKECRDYILKALEQEPVLDKIRTEIEKAVWEDAIVSLDGTDEVRIPRLDPDDVFEILDKYKTESEDKE